MFLTNVHYFLLQMGRLVAEGVVNIQMMMMVTVMKRLVGRGQHNRNLGVWKVGHKMHWKVRRIS
jgi:hypothetical protein